MFLKQIELINFKCHSNLILNFETNDSHKPIRKSTFLLGENGTGKSAVLKAIALVTAGSNALADLLQDSNSWIQNRKSFCHIKAIIVTAKGEERYLELKIRRDSDIREILSENRQSLEELDKAIKNADRNYFILGYGASRRLNRGGTRISGRHVFINSPRTHGLQSMFNNEATLVSLADWAMDLDYSSNGTHFRTIKSAINEFLVENVKFKGIDKQRGQLIFTTKDGNVPIDQLSDGYQNVISWVGDLMYNVTTAFRNYKKPLHARGVLLIDEIDLHLHPKWQRRLHTFLETKLPNFQIIATTHSPLTAQQAGEDELYALRRQGKKVEVVPFIGNPSNMLLHQILMSPIFGVESDESIDVEKTKNRIRELVSKSSKTLSEKEEEKQLKKQAKDLPINVRSNSLLQDSDIALLHSINKSLNPKSKS